EGTRVYAGTAAGSARGWAVDTGAPLPAPAAELIAIATIDHVAHKALVVDDVRLIERRSAAFTSDDQTAVLVQDSKLRVANAKTSKSRFAQLKLPGDASLVALASDTVAVVAYDGGIAIVDLAAKKLARKLALLDAEGDPRSVRVLAVSPNGKRAV